MEAKLESAVHEVEQAMKVQRKKMGTVATNARTGEVITSSQGRRHSHALSITEKGEEGKKKIKGNQESWRKIALYHRVADDATPRDPRLGGGC